MRLADRSVDSRRPPEPRPDADVLWGRMMDTQAYPITDGTDGFAVRLVDYAPNYAQAPHIHSAAKVTLVYSGWFTETSGRRSAEAAPLSIAYKPAGTKHADRYGDRGARTLHIDLEPVVASAVEGTDALLKQWLWVSGGPAAKQFLDIVRAARHGPADIATLEFAVFDGIAALARYSEPGNVASAPRWLHRVREEMDDRLEDRLRVHLLARAAGVHPVSLARAFRRHFDTSVTQYLHRQRVRRAAHLLANCDGTLCSVASGTGFADQSHFTRVFKRLTGLTPGLFRSVAQSRRPPTQ